MKTRNAPALATLEGLLGRDFERRQTATHKRVVSTWNPIALGYDRYETETTPRDYLTASLAVRTSARYPNETVWYRLFVFDLHRTHVLGARLGRKGDRIRVTGRLEPYTYTAPDGTSRTTQTLYVDTFSTLAKKIRQELA